MNIPLPTNLYLGGKNFIGNSENQYHVVLKYPLGVSKKIEKLQSFNLGHLYISEVEFLKYHALCLFFLYYITFPFKVIMSCKLLL